MSISNDVELQSAVERVQMLDYREQWAISPKLFLSIDERNERTQLQYAINQYVNYIRPINSEPPIR